jgi:hypothetical protein
MAKNDVPQSGKGTNSDRLSDSPLSIRRGNADPTDIDPSEVQTNAGEFDYDENNLPTGVEPPAFGTSH